MNRLSWKIVAGPAFVCVSDVFSRALASGFSQGSEYLRLWTAYLDYLRRRVHWNEGINYFRFLFSRPSFLELFRAGFGSPRERETFGIISLGLGFLRARCPSCCHANNVKVLKITAATTNLFYSFCSHLFHSP